ncbi:uromodulin-like [Lissotriton helveticus]
MSDTTTTLQRIEEKGSCLDIRLSDVEQKISDALDVIAKVDTLTKEVHLLKKSTEDLKNRNCRNNLRIYGIPESSEGSDMINFLKTQVLQILGLPKTVDLNIQKAHRLGPQNDSSATKPTDECEIEPKSRVECGDAGITIELCNEGGCCYDDRKPGTTWCFRPLQPSGVLECNPACADNELCTDSAGYAECKCQRSKYLNASRSDIIPTVQCEGSAMTLSLYKCLLERFGYSITQMHFADSNCIVTTSLQLVGNEHVVQVNAILQAGWCGNVLMVNNDKTMTLSNVLYIPPDDSSGIIISSLLMFTFSCTYNMTMQTSLLTALHPIIGIATLPSVNGSGTITATMAAYKSNSFTDPLTEDDTLTVGTPLYIGISTTFSDGDKFTLRAERCVAAPSNNPADASVELIAGGCAVTQDVNVHVIQNGLSLQVMFEIETFIFKEQSEVYMRCDVSLCPITPSNTCQCSSSSRSANEDTVTIKMAPIGISGINHCLHIVSHCTAGEWSVLTT